MSWSFVTDFGDSAVTVPIALAIALWLLASDAWRGALAWLSLFGAGALSVFCTKVAYAGWGVGVREIDFTGISGHAFTATSALAVAGYFLGGNCSKPADIVGGSLGFLAGVVVGVSRVVLGDHSVSEAVVGCALGGAIAVAAIAIIRPRVRIVAAPLVFAFTIVALAFALHGQKAPSEQLAVKVALFLSGRTTPFARGAP
ncbi:MAG: phosphatase PAP2 family protein [Roseiarcus sp.]